MNCALMLLPGKLYFVSQMVEPVKIDLNGRQTDLK